MRVLLICVIKQNIKRLVLTSAYILNPITTLTISSLMSDLIGTLLILFGLALAALAGRLIAVLPCFDPANIDPSNPERRHRPRMSLVKRDCKNINNNDKPKLMVLLGSGGHTGEMIRILTQIDIRPVSRTWIISSGDSTSAEKAKWYEETHDNNSSTTSEILELHRARRVGESMILSIKNTLISSIKTGLLVYKRSPDVLLVNGPGTSVPLAYVLFLLRFLGIGSTKIIYIESLARLEHLSVSGMLILPIADRFLVQSKTLGIKYRRAEYYGILV